MQCDSSAIHNYQEFIMRNVLLLAAVVLAVSACGSSKSEQTETPATGGGAPVADTTRTDGTVSPSSGEAVK
jgi:hypothetical protein